MNHLSPALAFLFVALSPGRAQAAPPAPAGWIWGLTSDAPATDTPAQVAALAALPKRAMLRCVFDPPEPASHYLTAVRSLAGAADLMALPLDSSELAGQSLAAVQARMADYLATLGGQVKVWEIGNEVNGNWLGTDPLPKITAMFEAARAAGAATAITFYHSVPALPGYDLLPWIDAHLPPGHPLRGGLDYVLVSYYEDVNGGHQLSQAELDSLFQGLARRFPHSRLGFGEFGYGQGVPGDPARRADLFERFWSYRVPSVPAYLGGGFYWEFRQTMVPATRPDWQVLSHLQSR